VNYKINLLERIFFFLGVIPAQGGDPECVTKLVPALRGDDTESFSSPNKSQSFIQINND